MTLFCDALADGLTLNSTYISRRKTCEHSILYNGGMKLRQVAMGVLFVLIAFAVFALTSQPKDQLPELQPYVTSKTNSYYVEDTATGKPRYVFEQKYTLDGRLDLSQVQAMTSSVKPGTSHGFSYFTDLPEMKIRGIPSSFTAPGPKSVVSAVKYWRELKWNQILWVRLTHLGRNPFEERVKWTL